MQMRMTQVGERSKISWVLLYVQEFKRAARGSGYKGRVLVEKFKRGLSRVVRRKLAEAETSPTTITQ